MKHLTSNKYIFLLPLSLFTVSCLFFAVRCVYAVNMNTDRYRLQFGTINMGGAKMTDPSDGSYNLSTSLGQAAAKEFQSSGYIVKAGFQYIYSRIPFTFSLSNTRIDFGTVAPSTPATGQLTLRVSFGGAGQYVVTARADGPFRNMSGASFIPHTSCNGGADTCTISTAKPWTQSSAYGFGYSMSGSDIPTDFINSTYYRPFPDLIASQNPAIIMQSSNVTANITPTPNPAYTPAPTLTGTPRNTIHQSVITMKTNISVIQQAGSYATVIRFLATPSF